MTLESVSPAEICRSIHGYLYNRNKSANGYTFSLEEKNPTTYKISISPSTHNQRSFVDKIKNLTRTLLQKSHFVPDLKTCCHDNCQVRKRVALVTSTVSEEKDTITIRFTSIYDPPLPRNSKRTFSQSSSSSSSQEICEIKKSAPEQPFMSPDAIISWCALFDFPIKSLDVNQEPVLTALPYPLEEIRRDWTSMLQEWKRIILQEYDTFDLQKNLVFPETGSTEKTPRYALRMCYALSQVCPHIPYYLSMYFQAPHIYARQVSTQEMYVEIASCERYNPEKADPQVQNLIQSYPELSCSVFRFSGGDIRYVLEYLGNCPTIERLTNCETQVIEEEKKLIIHMGPSLLNRPLVKKPIPPFDWKECILNPPKNSFEDILFVSLPEKSKVFQKTSSESSVFLITIDLPPSPIQLFDLQQQLNERAAPMGIAVLFDLLNPNTALVEFSSFHKEEGEKTFWRAPFSYNESSLTIEKRFLSVDERKDPPIHTANKVILNIYRETIPEATCVKPLNPEKVQGLNRESLFSKEKHHALLGASFIESLLCFWNQEYQNLTFGEIAVCPKKTSPKKQTYTLHLSFSVAKQECILPFLLHNICLLPNREKGLFCNLTTSLKTLNPYTIEITIEERKESANPQFFILPEKIQELSQNRMPFNSRFTLGQEDFLLRHLDTIWGKALIHFDA